MRKITIKNKSIPANPRSDNYPAGSTVMRSGNGSTTIIGGGSGSPDIDILKTTDNKSATDRNVFSALRACSEFISKKANDTVQGIIDFAQGIKLKHKSITDLVCSGEETELSDSNILSSSKTVEVIEQRAISRLRDDNTAGHITFEKGITTLNLMVQELAHTYDLQVDHVATLFQTIIKDFVSSETFLPGMMGEGMKLYKALSGDWNLELDNVTVRKAITTFEMVIAKIRAVNGGLVVSAANGSVKSVSETTGDPAYYVLGIEGDMTFAADDLVRCQVFTAGRVKHYWLPIEQINGDSILLLKSGFPDGVTPAVGDELVQMGNRTDTSRQGVLHLTASEDGRPRFSVLDGINSPSLAGKNNTVLGCLDGITDTDLPADFQPSGYGLYSMNVFLKGIFILRNGKSIDQALTELSTQIEAIPGQVSMKVTEEVGKIQLGGRNYVRNSHITYSVGTSTYWQRVELANGMIAGETYILSLQTVVNSGVVFILTDLDNVGGQAIAPGVPFVLSKPKRYFAFTNNGFGQDGIFYNIKIEKGNKATDWTPAPEDMDARMTQAELSLKPDRIWMGIKSNIQLGGRNYFKKSTPIIPLYGTSQHIERSDSLNGLYLIGESSGDSAIRMQNVIDSNGLWTVSFDVKGTQGTNCLAFRIDVCDNPEVTDGKAADVYLTSDNEWHHHEYTFNVQNYSSAVFNFVDFENLGWLYIYVRNLKIEKGSFATDWTPAPEDMDARMTQAENNLQPENIWNGVKPHVQASTVPCQMINIDARGLDENMYYPVIIHVPNNPMTTITLHYALEGATPSWSTHTAGFSVQIRWTTNGCGWGTISVQRIIHEATQGFNVGNVAGSIGQITQYNKEYIYVRGGGFYHLTVEGTEISPHTGLYPNGYQEGNDPYVMRIDPISSVTFPVASIPAIIETGIDITNRKMILTADKTVFRNNGGGQIAVFENDRIKADLIDARQIVVNGLNAGRITTGNLNVTDGANIGNFTITNGGLFYGGGNPDGTIRLMQSNGRSSLIQPGRVRLYNPNANDSPLRVDGPGATVFASPLVSYSSLNMNIRVTSWSLTLSNADCYVVCRNSSNISVTLPNNPTTGQVIYLKRQGSGVTIYGGTYRIFKGESTTSVTIGSSGDLSFFVFDGSYWNYQFIGR